MRVFIAVLVLIFNLQFWTKADDIRDYEIEGMSIGNSALDFFSKEEIKKNIVDYMTDNKFTMTCFSNNLKTFDEVCLMFKSNDKNNIIHGISGELRYVNKDINYCFNKQKEIDNEISILFKNLKRKSWGILKLGPRVLEIDPNATYNPITYDFKNEKERLQISCYDFSEEDWLKVILYTEYYGAHITQDAIEVN